MRIVTETYPVYHYSELSEDAQEKARRWYLDDYARTDMFTDYCNEYLSSLFPQSEMRVEYSLCYCQGDGLNICGRLYLDEVIEHIKDKFTAKELKFFEWVFDSCGSGFEMKSNNRYCYCICDRHDYGEDIVDYMEMNNMKNIPYGTIDKMTREIRDYLSGICSRLEKDGYDWFYHYPDENISEDCDANNWEFTGDGEFYVG